jgi:hypothetical protein
MLSEADPSNVNVFGAVGLKYAVNAELKEVIDSIRV